ncbi:TRAP transporter substrate-binding protein [Castellaniella sp.]|uniref:TRAP transporter substrate-binding protein n=1 Tax=Castellaniella sp. TaxID=1955812 RepID=UPI0035630F69
MTTRRSFLNKAVASAAGVGGLAAIGTPALAQGNEVIRWRCTSSFPKNLDILYGCAEVLSDAVAAATDNKFQIQVFAAGEIVPGGQAFDAASNNTVQMCHSASYYYTGKDPAFAFGTHAPFMLDTRQQNAWAYHGEGKQLLEDFYRKYNIVALPGGNTTTQMGGWFRNEIKSLDDLKGLKFRLSGLGGQALVKIGVVPQQIGAGDIYPALERGTIDAAEFNGPYDDEKLGLYKVAPHYYYPGFWDGTSMQHFFINTAEWDKLPKHYQAILKSCAAEANIDSIARYDVVNPPVLRKLVASGVKLHAFPPEVLDAAYKATMELYEELADTNPEFKKLYLSQKAFQKDAALWNQVSEYAYDSVINRQLRQQG